MKKLEFKSVLRLFGIENRIGTYKVDGQETDMYTWHDCVFYFGKDGKATIIGTISMALGYHLFLNFGHNPHISFENDNRGQWIKSNITIDSGISEKEKEDILTKKLLRIYTISSLKTLIAFFIFVNQYEQNHAAIDKIIDPDDKDKVESEIERVARFDAQVEEYYLKAHTAEEVLTGLSLDIAAKTPQMPNTFTIPKAKWTPERAYLKSNLDEFDFLVNPLQSSNLARQNYLSYLDKIDLEIDHNEDKTAIKLSSKSSETKATYECAKNSVMYDGLIRLEELQYLRIRHNHTRYIPCNHLSGEIIELIPRVTSPGTELTRRATIYNLSEDLMFKGGKWYRPTSEELELLANTVAIMNSVIKDDITNHMLSNNEIRFTPVKK